MKKITINEAIRYFDTQCPNQFEQNDKINWLSELDEIIFNEIIKNRKNPPIKVFIPYTTDDLEKELLVPSPHTEIYRYWLEKSVNYANREMNAFNNSANMFSNYYDDFFKSYNRTHQMTTNGRWRV